MKKAVVFILVLILMLLPESPTLAAKRDKIDPFITNTNPFDGQRNVLTDNRITLQFSELLLKGNDITRIKIMESGHTSIGYTYTLRDNILVLTMKRMKHGTPYHIIIPSAAVKDLSGNNMKEDFELDFVTESTASANGSETVSQEEVTVTHRMIIDTAMAEEFGADEEAYLIAALKAIGVQTKQISVNKAVEEPVEEGTEEEPEETTDAVEASTGETVEEEEIVISFDVFLVDCGTKKLDVIKVIWSLTGLSLAEAKRLADNSDRSPQLILEGVSDFDARLAGRRLEDAGAVVSISDHEQNAD